MPVTFNPRPMLYTTVLDLDRQADLVRHARRE